MPAAEYFYQTMTCGDVFKVRDEVTRLSFWHSVLPLLLRCETRCPDLQAGVSPQRLNPFKPKALLLRDEQEFGCGARQRGRFEPETTQSPPKYPNLPAVSSSP